MRPPDLFFVWWPYVFFVARFKSRCSEMRHTPSSKWRAERLLVQLPTYRGPEAKRAATAQSSSLNELDDDAMRAVLAHADVPSLLSLCGVNKRCKKLAQQPKEAVQEVHIEAYLKANGPGVQALAKACRHFPNLARLHAHGLQVDLAQIKQLPNVPTPAEVLINHVKGNGTNRHGLALAVHALAMLQRDTTFQVTVPVSAFAQDTTITSIEVPNGFTSIGNDAFTHCTLLASVELPAGLTSIGHDAFWACSSLASVVLPADLTSIGHDAFQNCSSLASVALPAGLTSIDDGVFWDCSSLAKVELPAGLTSIGQKAFEGCKSLATVALPDRLTSIGAWGFADCTSLASVVLPASLTSIGDLAFAGCTSLASVELPAGLTSIGDGAFRNCSLASVDLPAGLTSIGYGAFQSCKELASVKVPASVTSISVGAFRFCSSLASVELPAGLESIGACAFPVNCTRKRKRDEDETT